MSLHRQPCPSCGRELELPADAIGRMAKCPACEATFRIAETGGNQPAASPDPVPPTPSESSVPSEPPTPGQPPESVRGDKSAGSDNSASSDNSAGSENPFQSPIARSSETTGSASGRPVNPYQATSYSAEPVLQLGETEIVQRPIEDIVSPTLAIFGARWAPLILAALILLVATGVIFGVPFLLMSIIGSMIDNGAIPNGGPILAIAALLFFPFIAFLSCYTTESLVPIAAAVGHCFSFCRGLGGVAVCPCPGQFGGSRRDWFGRQYRRRRGDRCGVSDLGDDRGNGLCVCGSVVVMALDFCRQRWQDIGAGIVASGLPHHDEQ